MNKTFYLPVYRVGYKGKVQCVSTGVVFDKIHGGAYLTRETAQKYRQEIIGLGLDLHEDMWEVHEDIIWLVNDCTLEDVYKAIQVIDWDSEEDE